MSGHIVKIGTYFNLYLWVYPVIIVILATRLVWGEGIIMEYNMSGIPWQKQKNAAYQEIATELEISGKYKYRVDTLLEKLLL